VHSKAKSRLSLTHLCDLCDVDKARLLAVSSPHAGDWLHALPVTAVGLRLSDEAVRG